MSLVSFTYVEDYEDFWSVSVSHVGTISPSENEWSVRSFRVRKPQSLYLQPKSLKLYLFSQ